MPIADVICKNCMEKAFGNYCNNCGQRTNIGRINIYTIINDVYEWAAKTYIVKTVITIFCMLKTPGISISNYIKGERQKHHSSVSYLIFWALVFTFMNDFNRFHNFHTSRLLDFSKVLFLLVLFVISTICYFYFLHVKFNIFEAIAIVAFIYGTAFVINSIIELMEILSHKYIGFSATKLFIIASNTPAAIYILYALNDLVKFENLSDSKLRDASIVIFIIYFCFTMFVNF